jgi:hypothetical protein
MKKSFRGLQKNREATSPTQACLPRGTRAHRGVLLLCRVGVDGGRAPTRLKLTPPNKIVLVRYIYTQVYTPASNCLTDGYRSAFYYTLLQGVKKFELTCPIEFKLLYSSWLLALFKRFKVFDRLVATIISKSPHIYYLPLKDKCTSKFGLTQILIFLLPPAHIIFYKYRCI